MWTIPDPEVSRAAPRLDEPLQLLHNRRLTSVFREHLPGLPGGPSCVLLGSQGGGRVSLDMTAAPSCSSRSGDLSPGCGARVDGSASLSRSHVGAWRLRPDFFH